MADKRCVEGWGAGLLACAGAAVGLALLLVVAVGPAAAQTTASITGTDPSPLTRANLHGATIHMRMSGVDPGGHSAVFPSGCGSSSQWNIFEGHSSSNRHLLTGEPSGVSVRVSAASTYGGRLNRENCSITLSVTGTLPTSAWTLTIRGNPLVVASTTGATRDNPYTIGSVVVLGTAPTQLVVDANPLTSFVERTQAVTVTEGASAAYTVKLASQPSGAVTVSVASSDPGAVGVQPSSLTFSGGASGTWNTAQTVTVSGNSDGDDRDESVTVSHTATAGSSDSGYTFSSARLNENVTVSVTDPDMVGLVVDTDLVTTGVQATPLSVSEGDTAPFTVALGTQPSAAVTIGVSGGGATEGAVAPGSLEFSTTSWNTAQTVTVTGAEDFVQDGDQTWDVTLGVPGSADTDYSGLSAQTVRVTTTDEDVAGVVVDTDLTTMGVQATTLNVDEDGTTSAEYTLVLGTIPAEPVVVTVGDDSATAVADLTKVGATPGTLTFTATSWNTAQTVTVEAEQDDDGAQDTVSLAHTVTSGDSDYNGRSVAAVAVRVRDDDDQGILPDTDPTTPTQDGGSLRVYEAPTHADHSVAYTVRLATQPVGGVVTVTVTPNDLTAVTVSPGTVEFTASNWNTAQRVTVTAVDDLDMSGEVLELAHAAAGGDYGSTTTSVSVLVTDDDTPGLNVSVARLRIEEQADDSMATGRYTVRLNTAPAGSATVTVGIVQAVTNSDIVVSPSGTGALEFTASSWETAQDVTVTVTADDDAVDDTTTLAHTAAGSGDYASVARVDVAVTVVDADEAGVEVTPRTLALTENHMTDGSAPYTVVLTTEPTEPVTIEVTSSDGDAVSRAPNALTFTASDWNTAQPVTASAAADDDAVDERVRVTHGLTGAAEYAAVRVPAVTVTVTDAEEQAIWVDTDLNTANRQDGPLEVNEDGSATYTVALGSEPVNPVVVRISDDNADVQAMPGVVRFDASDWDTAQTVTVRADGDADAVADMATLTHRAAGGDYTGAAEAVEVTVTVADDDGRLVISRPALTVLALQAATYTVQLGAQPAGNVTVTATSSTPAQATVGPAGSLGSRALTFSPTTWATPQTVTVTGVAAGSPTVRHTAADSGGAYTIATARAAENVRVEVEGAGSLVLIEPRYLAIVESTSQTYTIRPVTQPAGTVTVGISSGATHAGNGADSSREPFRHIFTPSDWDTAKTVTVRVVNQNNVWGQDRYVHALRNFDNAGATLTQRHRVVVEKVQDTTPTLAAVGAQTYRVGQRVDVRLPAGTGGNAPLSYTLTGPGAATDLTLPAGVTYTAGARRIQGTPEVAAAEATYTLRVRDADGDAATRTFGLTVAARALAGFGAAALPAAPYALEEAVDVVLPAPLVAQGTTPVLTFVLAPALPAGLRYAPPTANALGAYETGGRIVGTPTEETPRRTYRLTVVDLAGNEAATEFALATGTPAAPPPPAPPPPAGGPAPVGRQPTFGTAAVAAQVYRQGAAIMPLGLPAATGGDGPLGYALTPALPAGLTYTAPGDATSGGSIAGVPTAAQAATTYTLTATDADGDAARLAFTIAVEAAATGEIRPQEGTQTVTLYGQAVTVTQAPGTLAGVTLTLPATLAQAVTITLRPPAADVPLARGRYGFGLAGAEAAVDIAVTPVPVDGLGVCLPVPAELRAEAAGRAVVLLHYAGEQWAPVAGAQDAAAAGPGCAAGVRTFSPFAVGYRNSVPRFAEPVEDRTYLVNEASPPLRLPAATGGDGGVSYTLTPAELPAGLTYTLPTDSAAGEIAGTPTAGHAATAYTLTATDMDGDMDTVTFTLEVVRIPVQVTIGDAAAVEGAAVEFTVGLSRAVARALTVEWTAGRPGSATPGEDYAAEAAGRLTLAAGTTAGTLAVRTVDDRRVEPPETFTVTVAVPDDPLLEIAAVTAEGRIEDDDTERARQRSLGMVLAGVGRTLATDAVDVIGDRFIRQPSTRQVTVGGQALALDRDAQTGRWRQAAGVAYGVARALGVEVGAPVAGGAGEFGQVRGAAWSTLTRHLADPGARAAPLSAWDTAGAFAAPTGRGWGGPPAAEWGTGGQSGGQSPAWDHQAASLPFGRGGGPGVAGYGIGLGQGGFDRAHAATPQARQAGRFRAPVQFRRVSGAEVLSQSQFEMPLSRTASGADPAASGQPGEPAAQAAAWTLWGRGTASGFDGKPKDDFSMDGNVFTGYLGLDYRLQSNVLLGLAVAHSQGDVDYEARDVTEGDVDLTLTSVLPYAHWSPRPGLGVWGLFGAGWGNLDLKDEAGKVKTDLEMLMGAVGARQEVLTWRQIDVALKADAFLTELEAGADDRLPKTAGDAQRLRLMVEGRTAWALSEGSHLTPIFEIGGRWDGGKAETGVGAELGGGFEYAHTKLGLGIEARGRYLLAHQKSAFDEWGASLTLKLDPGADKRGLWLALAPVWGAEASQVEQMWGSAEVLRAQTDTDATPGLSPEQVEFDVGYGVVTHEGAGLLTTYGGLSMSGPGSHGYRLGGRIELGEWVDLSVEGERTTRGGGAEHQVALYGHLGW